MAFFLILFFIFLVFMTGITTLPFILVALVLSAVFFRKLAILLFAFLGGVVLDFSLFRPVGLTSLILVSFLLSTYLYSRRFEVRTVHFIFLSTFFGSLTYLKIFGYSMVIIQLLIAALIGVLLFKAFSGFNGRIMNYES